jgi:hypothetical protein
MVSDLKQSTPKGLFGFASGVSPADQRQNEILEKLALAIEELRDWKPTVAVETYEKELVKYKDINKRRGM